MLHKGGHIAAIAGRHNFLLLLRVHCICSSCSIGRSICRLILRICRILRLHAMQLLLLLLLMDQCLCLLLLLLILMLLLLLSNLIVGNGRRQ